MNIIEVNKQDNSLKTFTIEVMLMNKYKCKLIMYAENKNTARALFENFRKSNTLTGDFRKIKLQ